MHFIQVKVGKLTNDVPSAKLGATLNFPAKGSGLFATFQANVCGMQAVGQDIAFTAAAVAAGVPGVAAANPPLKVYDIEPTFELVTSRKIPVPVKNLLNNRHIKITSATDPSFWGPRVRAYCQSTQFALFQ